MNDRQSPIKRKIITAIIIDILLFIILVLASYSFFYLPAKAENGDKLASIDPAIVACANGDPCPTHTPEPSPTNTPEPTSTDTIEPSPTNTLEPSPTDTLEPSPTDTLEPTPTDTLAPTPTDTLEPTPTDTLVPPSPTNTSSPSSTPTLIPTITPTRRIEPSQTPTPTNPPPHKTNTPRPSATYIVKTKTPSITPTLIVNTCSNCYIVKDFRELIVSGLYSADMLNTESMTSTLNVSITLYNEYKGVVVGKTIEMIDKESANEVMHVETPLWCTNMTSNNYWIHTIVSVQNSNGKIWFEADEWIRISIANKPTTTP